MEATNQTEREITSARDLLSDNGELLADNEGWARFPLWRFNRDKALVFDGDSSLYGKYLRNLKEWDYYSFVSHEHNFGLCFTLADLGNIASLAAITFLDFESDFVCQVDSFAVRKKIGFASESLTGMVAFHDSKLQLSFCWDMNTGKLVFSCPTLRNKKGDTGILGSIVLRRPSNSDESINIATSWGPGKRHFFYHNQKINCLQLVEGSFVIGQQRYSLNPRTDFGALDWGRGVWTYENRWYWSSGSGSVNGVKFGWNFGYGFSDRSSASENCFFLNGKVHKVGEVVFRFDPQDYMSEWRIESNDGRIKVKMIPVIDRSARLNLVLAKSIQHQVFGRFSGSFIQDDGKSFEFDQVLGFAEDVFNCW